MIKSDGEISESEDRDSPQYPSASSEDEENNDNKIAPSKGGKERRLSQSLIMDDNQIKRALETFSASRNLLKSNKCEPSSKEPSQASRITDSTQSISSGQPTQGLKLKPNPSKREQIKPAAKMNLDAEVIDETNKPLTRSRARILASQNSQSIENNPLNTCDDDCIIPTHAPAPSGSRLTIKRVKN